MLKINKHKYWLLNYLVEKTRDCQYFSLSLSACYDDGSDIIDAYRLEFYKNKKINYKNITANIRYYLKQLHDNHVLTKKIQSNYNLSCRQEPNWQHAYYLNFSYNQVIRMFDCRKIIEAYC